MKDEFKFMAVVSIFAICFFVIAYLNKDMNSNNLSLNHTNPNANINTASTKGFIQTDNNQLQTTKNALVKHKIKTESLESNGSISNSYLVQIDIDGKIYDVEIPKSIYESIQVGSYVEGILLNDQFELNSNSSLNP
ncbi:hypothetical protein [Ectobacillus polymachus]|uniref:hypothetical protein n=1 Tax=Ectobacillus polymachus TaxID=1508806 RepID=UPI003A87391D